MNRNPYAFRLGLFVIVGLALALGGVFAVGFSTAFEPSARLHMYFFENVSGLEPGSQVRFRGVQIGSVDSVRVVAAKTDNGDVAGGDDLPIEVVSTVYPRRLGVDDVSMFLRYEQAKGLLQRLSRAGLRVRVAWADITGQKYLDLDYLDPAEFPAPRLTFPPQHPYVPTASERSFTDIQRDLAATVSNVAQIDFQTISDRTVQLLGRLNELADEIGEAGLTGEAKATLRSVRTIAEDDRIPELLDRMTSVAERLDRVTARADDLIQRPELDQAIGSLSEAAESMASSTRLLEERLPALLDDVDDTLAATREAVEGADLPATTASVRGAADSVGGAADDLAALRGDLRRTLGDLAAASRSISRLARFLEENPDALLKGRQP